MLHMRAAADRFACMPAEIAAPRDCMNKSTRYAPHQQTGLHPFNKVQVAGTRRQQLHPLEHETQGRLPLLQYQLGVHSH